MSSQERFNLQAKQSKRQPEKHTYASPPSSLYSHIVYLPDVHPSEASILVALQTVCWCIGRVLQSASLSQCAHSG